MHETSPNNKRLWLRGQLVALNAVK